MASKIQICNLAIAPLGGQTITSFTDGTREADLCAAIYDESVKTVIASGNWTAATYRAELAKLTTDPEWEFDSQFQLPTSPKILKLLTVNESPVSELDYRVEESKLLIDRSSVKIKYIGLISDPGSFGEYIKDTLVAYLTYKLSFPLVNSMTATKELYAIYQETLATNLMSDGQQSNGDFIVSPELTDVRGDNPDGPEL